MNPLNNVLDTVNEKPVKVTYTIRPKNKWHELMQRWGLSAKEVSRMIEPVKMGTLHRIAEELLKIDANFYDPKKIMESTMRAAKDYTHNMARVVALCMHNRPGDVPERMVKEVMDNFSARELQGVMLIVLKQMDIGPFINSIISMRGMNVVAKEVSLQAGEIIAPGESSAA